MRKVASVILASIAAAYVLVGCVPPQTVGDTPESRLNPAMTSHQKALRLGQQQNAGG